MAGTGFSLTSLLSTRRSGKLTVAPWLRLVLHRHARDPLDLSDALVSYQQSDRMAPPFSSWVATCKPSQAALTEAFDLVADDDWVVVDASLSGGVEGSWVPIEFGPVDAVRTRMVVDGRGAESWELRLSGRSWAKALTDTMVSSWQKLSDAVGSGSIFGPAKAEQFSLMLANGLFSPSAVMGQLLAFLLSGQWKLPSSLVDRYPTAGLGLGPLIRSGAADTVSGTGLLEVDGTAWRGLSLMGGVRGTVWEVIQALQNDPALLELWAGFTREIAASGAPCLVPALHYRRRPFSGPDWAVLPLQQVDLAALDGLDLGKTGLERFNVALVSPAIATADLEPAVMASNSGLPKVDAESIDRHGTRGWFLQDSLASASGDWAAQAEQQSEAVWSNYLAAPELLQGSLSVVGALFDPTTLGGRLWLTSEGQPLLEFYCEGLESRFAVGDRGTTSWRQTLAVTRGRLPAFVPTVTFGAAP